MYFKPGSLMFGVLPEILKDCAHQLSGEDRGFDREGFCRALGAPPSEALGVLDQMIDAGFIELSGAVGRYLPTASLNQLALAPVSWGLPREEADLLLARIVQKATEINEHPEIYPCSVLCLAVYGSYLGGKPHLGDLNIAVDLTNDTRRHLHANKAPHAFFRIMRVASNKSLSVLKCNQHNAVSICQLYDMLDMGTPYRVVFRATPASM